MFAHLLSWIIDSSKVEVKIMNLEALYYISCKLSFHGQIFEKYNNQITNIHRYFFQLRLTISKESK